MVADMIRRGQLTEAESRYHPNRSVITRALGTDANMLADVYELEAGPGDRLLLCSDGLTGMLEDAMIAETLASVHEPAAAARALVDAANDAGGHDNISVVIVDIEGESRHRRGAVVDPSGARSGRGWLALVGWMLLLVLVVGGIAWGVSGYAKSRAYVKDVSGYVVVYQGVPGTFAGISLSSVAEETTIPVSALDLATQSRLAQGIQLGSLSEAYATLATYRATAEKNSAPATLTPQPSPGGVNPVPGTGQ